MAYRYSILSGKLEKIPDPKPINAEIIALQVQLATATAQREAAEARCAELATRATEADQRAERVAADLERAHTRIEALAAAAVDAAAASSAASAIPDHSSLLAQPTPEPCPPVAYDAVVTKRDVDGKVARFELVPRSN